MKKYKLSFEEYFEATKFFLGIKIWIQRIVILTLSFFSVTGLFIITGNLNYQKYTNPTYLIILFLLTFVFSVFISLSRFRNHCRRVFESTKSIRKQYHITFNDKYSEWESENGNTKLFWKDIYSYKYNKKMIVLGVSICSISTIPMRIFENEKEKEKFLGYLKKNVKNK
jgi:hypothetical protein